MPHSVPMTDLSAVLARLVSRGVLTPEQASAVTAEMATGPADSAVPAGLRRLLAEIAGYLGAAFVLGATFLFLGQQWDELGRPGRVAVIAAVAIVLFGVGLAVRLWRTAGDDDIRRRLASTLMTGAAGAAGFATHVLLVPAHLDGAETASAFDRAVLIGGVVALLVAVAGYRLAPSAAGQLGMAAAVMWIVLATLELLDAQSGRPFGVVTLVVGLAWAAAAWAKWVSEPRFGLAIGVTLALVGAQVSMAGPDGGNHYLGHLLTALVAAACFGAYARVRDWVLLAGGVIGATVVVPEFLYDVTGGSLGASGVMLVAGVTLLGASLAGMRLRRSEEADQSA